MVKELTELYRPETQWMQGQHGLARGVRGLPRIREAAGSSHNVATPGLLTTQFKYDLNRKLYMSVKL